MFADARGGWVDCKKEHTVWCWSLWVLQLTLGEFLHSSLMQGRGKSRGCISKTDQVLWASVVAMVVDYHRHTPLCPQHDYRTTVPSQCYRSYLSVVLWHLNVFNWSRFNYIIILFHTNYNNNVDEVSARERVFLRCLMYQLFINHLLLTLGSSISSGQHLFGNRGASDCEGVRRSRYVQMAYRSCW